MISRNFLTVLFVLLFLIFPMSRAVAQDDLLTVGMKAYSNGQFALAEEALEVAYGKVSDDFRITYWLAQTYRAQGDYGKARRFYQETLTLFPTFPAAIYADLADVSLADGKYKEALNYIDTARERGLDTAYLRQMEGVALLNLERHDEALNAFQDVAAAKNELAQEAQLYAGFTQQAMQNIEAAERSFQSVLDIGRDDDLSVLARRQLGMQQALMSRAHKPFSLRAGLSFQKDSNPTVKPNDDAFVALANLEGESDYAKILTLGAGWQPQFSGPWGFSTNYDFYGNQYQDFGDQDVMSHSFTGTPFYRFKTMSFSLPLNFNYTAVDHDSYLRQYTVSPTLSIPVGNDYLWQLSGRGEIQRYATRPLTPEEDRDNKTFGLGAGFYWFLKGQDGFINLRADAAKTNADGANWDRDTFRFSGYLTYPLVEKLSGSLSLSYTAKNFDNVHSTAFVTRDDDSYSGTAALTYEIIDGLDATLSHTRQRNKSNIILYDYDRNITSFGLQKSWRF